MRHPVCFRLLLMNMMCKLCLQSSRVGCWRVCSCLRVHR